MKLHRPIASPTFGFGFAINTIKSQNRNRRNAFNGHCKNLAAHAGSRTAFGASGMTQ
jgi:hypothetical protein